MWIAERQAISPSTDENAAMAYQKFGRFETRGEALRHLIMGIASEIDSWTAMRMSAGRERQAFKILNGTNVDKAEVDGIRWQVREF